MNQPNTLELAKQGDEEAITSVINYLLQDKGITATAAWKETSLLILLKSAQLPDQQSSVALVRKVMMKLGIASLKVIEVYGKQIGQDSAAWKETLNLTAEVEEPKKQTKIENFLQQVNLKVTSVPWPAWFPYPSSWLRTCLVSLLLIAITVSLRVTGFWGILLSAVTNNPSLFIFLGSLGLLLPVILFSYIHHLGVHLWFLWKKQPKNTRQSGYLPSLRSFWEGFYALVVILLSFLVIVILFTPFLMDAGCTYNTVGQLLNCRELSQATFNNHLEKYYLPQIAVVVWFLTVAYLYQAEFLIRRHFTAKHLFKGLLITFFVALVASGIYFFQGSKVAEVKPLPIASEVPSPIPSIPATPPPSVIPSSPVPVEAASPSPQSDSFRIAVNTATTAANMAQLAKSQAEWNTVADQWQEAITLMKAVPKSSPNYAVAQQKVVQYQPNVAYARSAASRAK